MMSWNGGAGWAGWLLMSVGMIAFWGLVIIGLIALLPGVQDDPVDLVDPDRRPASQDPQSVLDERLARGQLDVQDYRALRELLRHGR